MFTLTYRSSVYKMEWNGIDHFRYIKIQPKTIDLSARLWGINTEFVGFIPQSLILRSIMWDWILINYIEIGLLVYNY